MSAMVLTSILLPFAGGLLVLVIPRPWIKNFSQAIALIAALLGLIVFIQFSATGKDTVVYDLLYLGQVLVFGIVIDRLSALIGMAVGIVGFLIVLYSTGYLSAQN